MRLYSFLILCLLFGLNAEAQSRNSCTPANRPGYLQLDLVRDFCADPKGRQNVWPALTQAARFITERGGQCALRIPAGQYRIGTQDTSLSGVVAFALYQCKNVRVYGDGAGKTRLFFADGLRYGGFGKDGRPREGTDAPVKAAPGNLIHLSNCSDIAISDLELDGRSDALVMGGYTSSLNGKLCAYQLPHSGIAIWNACSNIRIDRMRIHHFALDGLLLNPYKGKPDGVTIRNCRFEYNGRQGLSWAGGNNLRVEDCVFSHTGYGKVQDPPMAGVDIEPNGGPGTECTNGYFLRCRMENNRGYALLNPYNREVVSEQVRFDSCLFHDNDASTVGGVLTASVMVQGKKFSFDRCRIWGGFFYGHDAASANDATRFTRCDFSDQPLNGKSTPLPYLVYSERHTNFMLFDECTFRVSQPGKRFVYMINFNLERPDTYTRFRNCRFTWLPGHRIGWNESAVFKACRFEGQTRFENRATGSGPKYIETAAIWLPGSASPVKPDRLEVGQDVLWNHVSNVIPGKSKDLFRIGGEGGGGAEMVFGGKSALQMKGGNLDIAAASTLRLQAGSFLYTPGAQVRVTGRMQVDKGAYFNVDNTRFERQGGGRIQIDREASPLQKALPPFQLPPSGRAASPNGNAVIEGGNPAFGR